MRLRSDALFTTSIDGQTVILDGRTSNYLTVNSAGTIVMDLLQSEASVDELVQALVARFGITTEQASRDCTAFLGELRLNGFLVE
ncbi:PqqD family protein [uncultured Jatrophihabitans sp.]|uniref:PqqD family protein n=1 Tax=uncultured Jatrophihabitans sp. TaxID=1610747 RepID=UPI0035C9D38A